MKKFEEEVKRPTATGLIPMTYRENVLKELSKAVQENYTKNAQILREHKEYIEQLEARLKECEDLRIEANNQAAMEYSRKCEVVEDRAELKREITDLKSQLEKQQPEIPEFMANYIEAAKEDFWTLLSAMDDSNLSSRVGDWLKGGNFGNQEIFAQAWTNGYTVKEKRFYLKHIDMSKKYNSNVCVLAHGEGDVIYGHCDFPVGVFPSDNEFKFTLSQIDSMETGSYEQIEVQE